MNLDHSQTTLYERTESEYFTNDAASNSRKFYNVNNTTSKKVYKHAVPTVSFNHNLSKGNRLMASYDDFSINYLPRSSDKKDSELTPRLDPEKSHLSINNGQHKEATNEESSDKNWNYANGRDSCAAKAAVVKNWNYNNSIDRSKSPFKEPRTWRSKKLKEKRLFRASIEPKPFDDQIQANKSVESVREYEDADAGAQEASDAFYAKYTNQTVRKI